ncbi:MAG: DNA topoisomerase (ATP-hydrolyzing) subunit A [Spirochaetales bacterium]|nr:DNA topoisomerase (ATP-hydrolyzing) subunit A [Spirochaetales bacterium]
MSDLPGKVIPVNIEDEVKTSYLNYAMSVIVSRALPDVRDGLKPVHRRILFAMHEMGLRADRSYKKAGRIVGDVLGKYHPHGDQSIYDALVRLAQEFSMRYPVVHGQGNFGSVDGDPPAAMRYTEAKMHRIAEEILRDIEKNTVDFGPNYDDSLEEPLVMPTAFPYLLANGSSGIAVGMATNMAPHNLREICAALVALIDNPDATIEELMQHIKGPDFPTAAIIYGRSGIYSAFKTGRGQVLVRSRYDIEESRTGKQSIIVTELPYQVNKAQLIEHIADLVRDKKLEGISDLRDESDRRGIRMVIEIKKGFDPQVILNFLFSHTNLQQTFNVNNLALVHGRPEVLDLKKILSAFIEHRKEVIVRRTRFDLDAAEKRAHILLGLKIALDNIDEVIRIIKESSSVQDAKDRLMVRFEFSEVQAQAILDMRLQKLTSLETQKIIDELTEVMALIEYLKDLLAHDEKIMGVIQDETRTISQKYGDDRRTEIIDVELESVDLEDLIQEEDMVVVLSTEGYLKRVPLSAYRSQGRGGKGSNSANLKEEDIVQDIVVASTHAYILIISSLGNAYWVKTYQFPEGSRTSRGKHIRALLQMEEGETIKAIVPLEKFQEDRFIVMATRRGQVIRISTWEFRNAKMKGINGVTLKEGDSLVSATLTNGSNDLMVITKNGYGLRYSESFVRATGRNSQGVIGISLREEDDEVVSILAIRPEEQVLMISARGFGKRLDFSTLNPHGRGTMGQIVYKDNGKTGKLIGAISVSPEFDVVCITSSGKTLKCNTQEVSQQGRTSMGVRILDIDESDSVVGIARALKDSEEGAGVENVVKE